MTMRADIDIGKIAIDLKIEVGLHGPTEEVIAKARALTEALAPARPLVVEGVHPEWSKEIPQELTQLRAGSALDRTTIDILRRDAEEHRGEIERLTEKNAADDKIIAGQLERIRSLESEVHRLNEWKKNLLETAGSISESSSAGGPSSEGAPPLAPKVQGQPAEVFQPPAIAALGKRRGPAEYDVYLDPGQPGGVAIEPSNEQKETQGQAAEAGVGHPAPTVADAEKNAAEEKSSTASASTSTFPSPKTAEGESAEEKPGAPSRPADGPSASAPIVGPSPLDEGHKSRTPSGDQGAPAPSVNPDANDPASRSPEVQTWPAFRPADRHEDFCACGQERRHGGWRLDTVRRTVSRECSVIHGQRNCVLDENETEEIRKKVKAREKKEPFLATFTRPLIKREIRELAKWEKEHGGVPAEAAAAAEETFKKTGDEAKAFDAMVAEHERIDPLAQPTPSRWGKVADPGAAFHIWPLEDSAEAECGEITDAEVTFIEGRPPAEEACCDCAELSGWNEPYELSRITPEPPAPQQTLQLDTPPKPATLTGAADEETCLAPGCLIVVKGKGIEAVCEAHLTEISIRREWFFERHPDLKPKPEKKLALKKGGGGRKKSAPAEEGKPDA